MLTLELSSHLLEFPIDAYMQLGSISYWRLITQPRVLLGDWLIMEYTEKTALRINMPY
mgnify:CR=1 FL=1